MSLDEILQKAGAANISVSIGINDLRQFLDEVASNKVAELEHVKQAQQSYELLTPAEACKMLKISRSTLERWKRSAYLSPKRVGGQLRYRQQDIERILNTKANQ